MCCAAQRAVAIDYTSQTPDYWLIKWHRNGNLLEIFVPFVGVSSSNNTNL